MADGRIIIDTSIDSSGAEKGVKSLGSKLGSLTKTAVKTTAAMVTAGTGAVAALAKVSIDQYAEYEQLVGGVETLFGAQGMSLEEYAKSVGKTTDKVKKEYNNLLKSQQQVLNDANDAYKTAGMSANEYMSTISGFAASLLQGLGGDTKKAAEIGNMAVKDMSDNANKMGTSMELIQNAYQGFAKQKYTMLDNLKLGYGGTKTEMQRLLQEASKISGIKYDISNFDDIIEAIHVIQTEMGITGTTAEEAASTIEGSLNMTKAAWSNLLTGLADDNADFDTLINNLVDSASAFGDNILPRIEIAIKGIGELVEKLLPPIVARIPQLLTDVLPSLLNAGVQMIGSLGNGLIQALPVLISCGVQAIQTILTGITSNLPQIVSGAMQIIQSLVDGLIQVLPLLLDAGLQLIIALGQGIAENLPALVPQIVNLLISMCDTIIENLPLLISVAIDIILALAQGLITALPTLIAEVPRIINSFTDALFANMPQLILAGIQIIGMLIVGLIQSIPTLIANIPQIIMAIVNAVTLYNWWNLGSSVVTKIGDGIKELGPKIGNIAKGVAERVGNSITGIFKGGLTWGRNLISSIGQGISSMASFLANSARSLATNALNAIKTKFTDGFNIGKNLIEGIWNGISNMKQWILDKIGGFAGTIISGIKGFFDIHSPSRIMRDLIGVNLVKGIGVGIDVETPNLQKDIDSNMGSLVAKMQSTVDYETAMTNNKVAAYSDLNIHATSNDKYETRLSDNDISKLAESLSRGITVVKVDMNEKNLINAIAEPITTFMETRNKRKGRLEGAI